MSGKFGAEGAIGHLINALSEDLDALFHFLHFDPVSVPAIAQRAAEAVACADFEIELRVDGIGPGAAEVQRDAAAFHQDLKIEEIREAIVGVPRIRWACDSLFRSLESLSEFETLPDQRRKADERLHAVVD